MCGYETILWCIPGLPKNLDLDTKYLNSQIYSLIVWGSSYVKRKLLNAYIHCWKPLFLLLICLYIFEISLFTFEHKQKLHPFSPSKHSNLDACLLFLSKQQTPFFVSLFPKQIIHIVNLFKDIYIPQNNLNVSPFPDSF